MAFIITLSINCKYLEFWYCQRNISLSFFVRSVTTWYRPLNFSPLWSLFIVFLCRYVWIGFSVPRNHFFIRLILQTAMFVACAHMCLCVKGGNLVRFCIFLFVRWNEKFCLRAFCEVLYCVVYKFIFLTGINITFKKYIF